MLLPALLSLSPLWLSPQIPLLRCLLSLRPSPPSQLLFFPLSPGLRRMHYPTYWTKSLLPPLSVHTSPLVLRSMRCRQQPHCFPKSPRSFISLMAFPFLPGSDSHRVFLQKCSSPELTIKLCVCARERGRGRGEGGRESNTTVWQREAALESC